MTCAQICVLGSRLKKRPRCFRAGHRGGESRRTVRMEASGGGYRPSRTRGSAPSVPAPSPVMNWRVGGDTVPLILECHQRALRLLAAPGGVPLKPRARGLGRPLLGQRNMCHPGFATGAQAPAFTAASWREDEQAPLPTRLCLASSTPRLQLLRLMSRGGGA